MTWAGYLLGQAVPEHRRPHPHRGDRRDRALADPDRRRARPGAATALSVVARPGAGGSRRHGCRRRSPSGSGGASATWRPAGPAAAVTAWSPTNLAVAFPELSRRRSSSRLARASWQHLGMTVVELARLLARPLQATLDELTIDGREHMRRGRWPSTAVRSSSPRTSATGSTWRRPPAGGLPLAIVVRPLDSPALRAAGRGDAAEDRSRADRQAGGPPTRAAGPAPGTAGRASCSIRTPTRREGVFVPFFGRPASTSRSMALLALRTRTPIVPVFIRREGPGRHRVVVEPALSPPPAAANDLEAGDRRTDSPMHRE